MGHYRRVNPYVWQMWARAYPGSGPSIWVVREGLMMKQLVKDQ